MTSNNLKLKVSFLPYTLGFLLVVIGLHWSATGCLRNDVDPASGVALEIKVCQDPVEPAFLNRVALANLIKPVRLLSDIFTTSTLKLSVNYTIESVEQRQINFYALPRPLFLLQL